jgi:hypothetical protein
MEGPCSRSPRDAAPQHASPFCVSTAKPRRRRPLTPTLSTPLIVQDLHHLISPWTVSRPKPLNIWVAPVRHKLEGSCRCGCLCSYLGAVADERPSYSIWYRRLHRISIPSESHPSIAFSSSPGNTGGRTRELKISALATPSGVARATDATSPGNADQSSF